MHQSISVKCGLVSNVVFWVASLLGLYADHLVKSKKSPLLARCKLQPNQHLSPKEKLDLILLSFFNMIIVALFICCPIFEWLWNHIQHHPDRLAEADDWIWHRELLLKLPIHAIVAESGFYSIHVIMHRYPFLYRHIHKVHHRFIAPTAMACVYAHPLEFAFGNIFPIYLGPMLTNAHPMTCYIFWFPLAMAGTCKGHCGYRIMGLVDPHDAHHFYFKLNYGGMYLADYLFGTTTKHPSEKKDEKLRMLGNG